MKWAPFKEAVLQHVAAQSDTQIQSAIVARADNEAISSLGVLMTGMCSQMGTLTAAVHGMQHDVDGMSATIQRTVCNAIRSALMGAANAVGGGSSAPELHDERPEYRAQSPPRSSSPPTARAAPAMKAYIALGKVGLLSRRHSEWHYGDPDTCGQPLKNMKVRRICTHVRRTRLMRALRAGRHASSRRKREAP